MQRMTAHRKTILAILDDELPDSGGCAPYSASSVHWELERMHQAGEIALLPNKRQLYRTLSDLWYAGLIVASRKLSDGASNTLPYWELMYEVSESVQRNTMVAQCNELHIRVKTAKFGLSIFRSTWGKGATKEQVKAWTTQARSLAQRTHPDKVGDTFKREFLMVTECLKWLKAIPDVQH